MVSSNNNLCKQLLHLITIINTNNLAISYQLFLFNVNNFQTDGTLTGTLGQSWYGSNKNMEVPQTPQISDKV